MMFLSRSTFFGIAACAAAAAHLANKLYCHFIAVKQQEQCMQEVRMIGHIYSCMVLVDHTIPPQLRDKMLLPLPILEQLRDEMIQQVVLMIRWPRLLLQMIAAILGYTTPTHRCARPCKGTAAATCSCSHPWWTFYPTGMQTRVLYTTRTKNTHLNPPSPPP